LLIYFTFTLVTLMGMFKPLGSLFSQHTQLNRCG